MHPILIQYFHDRNCQEIEKNLEKTEEELELELNLTPKTMMKIILNPSTMYKVYCLRYMVEILCQGIWLPMMSENVTNVQMY